MRGQIVDVKYASQLKIKTKTESEETFDILKGPLDCNSNNVIYLFEFKKCQFKFPHVGSTVTKFRFRFNNYKIPHREFRKKLKKRIIQEIKEIELKQKLFDEHYCSDGHEVIANLCVTCASKERTVLDKQVEYLGSSWT